MASPWKQLLLGAIESNSHLKHSSYFQFATISSNGRPANRTVVFRGFEDGTDKIQINTDRRSHKVGSRVGIRKSRNEIKGIDITVGCYITYLLLGADLGYRKLQIEDLRHCPFAEICWYLTDTWEQFRVSGKVDVIDGTTSDTVKLQQREKSWFSSSMRSRLQYLGPEPGVPSIGEAPLKDPELDPSAGPVDAFCLMVLDPDQVDYLNLKTNTRTAFT